MGKTQQEIVKDLEENFTYLNRQGLEELETITDYFFKNRFSENRLNFDKGYSYWFEWAERFHKGSAYQCADLESQTVLKEMEKSGMLDNFRQTGLNRKW